MTASLSLRLRYQWPEACRLNPEISPRTRTKAKFSSIERLSARASSETVYSGRLERSGAAIVRSSMPHMIAEHGRERDAAAGGGLGRTRACARLGDFGLAAGRHALLRAGQCRDRRRGRVRA